MGTNSFPEFRFQNNSIFQNQMIDVGTSAFPVIVDINGDGLPDLLVGDYGYFDSAYMYQGVLHSVFTSKLSYFKNIGKAGNPIFHLVTDNFANLSGLHATSLYPAFYDLDGDGDVDMITGNADGTLWYYNNLAGAGKDPVFAPVQKNYFKIDAGEFSAPQLFDLDEDGLPDLLIGNRKGTLIYYHNTGTRTLPAFTHITDSLGKVDVTDHNLDYDGMSTPFFFKDPFGKTGLIVGSKEGKIHYYTNIDGNLGGRFTLSDSLLTNIIGTALPGSYGISSAACIANLGNPEFMDLVVGNFSGGLNYFSHTSAPTVYTTIEEKGAAPVSQFSVFPNPANKQLFIRVKQKSNSVFLEATLYNSLGQLSMQKSFLSSDQVSLQVSNLPEGIYLLTISSNSPGSIFSKFTAKIVVIH
jgi:hypothetical protein